MLSQREQGTAERKSEEVLAVFHLIRPSRRLCCGMSGVLQTGGPCDHPQPQHALHPWNRPTNFQNHFFVPNFKLLRTEEKTQEDQLRWFPQTIIVTKSYGSWNNFSHFKLPRSLGDLAAGREMISFFLEVCSLWLKWVKSWRVRGFQK